MRGTGRMLGALVIAGGMAGVLAVAPMALAGSTGSVEIEADLVSPATGARIAAITGSVNAKGQGYASIVPLSGAGGTGMVRGEAAQMRRQPDGSLLVKGGLGTRVWLAANERTSKSAGAGRLALALNARRTVPVAATGVAWSKAFAPTRGQRIIVVGTATGAVRNALAARYRLVRYSPGTYSRAALLANPALYRTVAGVLIGQDVTRAQMNGLDLARSFYNSGRWVATSGDPTALDQHMYVVAHAHLGRAGIVMRRATPAMGAASTQSMQLREPRIVHVRVGVARTTLPARPSARNMSESMATARRHLALSLARGERLNGQQSNAVEHGTAQPPVVSNTTGLATMQVRVDQQMSVVVDTPSYLNYVAAWLQGAPSGSPADGWLQCTGSPTSGAANPNATLNFVPQPGSTCPSAINSQVVGLTYDNLYTVSLSTAGGSGGAQQLVTETSALQVDAVAKPAGTGMAAGTYSVGSNIVQPANAGILQWYNNGGSACSNDGCPPNFFQNIYTQPQFSALGLQQANHAIAVACAGTSGCRGTAGGRATLAYSPGQSSPVNSVVQATSGVSSGSDWSLSQSSTSGWSVGGNLGFFGGNPMGGVTGGYNSSKSTTRNSGGNMSVSTDFTLANWVTSPSNAGNQALYSTSSQNVPGAPPGTPAFPAGQAFSFNSQSLVNNGGYVPLPAAYGSSNPGPNCAWPNTNPATYCTPGVVGAFGSQMNANGYLQGSVTSFTLDTPGNNSLAIGSVNPSAADTLYLWEQWINNGFCNCTSQESWGGLNGASSVPSMGGVFTELQVLDLDKVAAAQADGPSATAATSGPNGSKSGGGITGGVTTYYGSNGQVLSAPSKSQIVYTTLGLDLCAPPVLTSNLWAAGCDKAPGLAGPPATAAGSGPTITAPAGAIQTGAKGQATAPSGTQLTCTPGSWSGSPTSLTYQWSSWNQSAGGWGTITGATGNTYTITGPGYVECTVTAKNAQGGTQASTPSVETIAASG